MKKQLILLILGLCITLSLYSEENKQKAYLEIDGKEYEIVLGEKSEIQVGDKTHTVKVRLNPYRIFNISGISFKYSTNMGYNLDDSDPNIKIWSIDGDSASIMVQKYLVNVGLNDLVNAIQFEYKRMKAETTSSDIELKYKNGTIQGKRLNIKMGPTSIQQNLFMLKETGGSVAIILQDSLKENGKNTDEYIKMEKLFKESLEMKK